jgi:hypothetical protein
MPIAPDSANGRDFAKGEKALSLVAQAVSLLYRRLAVGPGRLPACDTADRAVCATYSAIPAGIAAGLATISVRTVPARVGRVVVVVAVVAVAVVLAPGGL